MSDATQPLAVDQLVDGTRTIVDRTGRHWTTEPPAVHRRQVQDIIRQQPGATFEGRKDSIEAVFQRYLSQEIQSVVIRETNREAERSYGEWNATRRHGGKRSQVRVFELSYAFNWSLKNTSSNEKKIFFVMDFDY